MKIIVDAFGGDNAPLEVLKGCQEAVREYHVDILLTGDEEKIKACASGNNISLEHMEIMHAPLVMPVEEEPTEVLRSYKDSSMALGLRLLSYGKGDAFLSAGSTGALVVGASLIVKRMKGVKRAVLGTVIPARDGAYLLVDAGANADCRPEMLVQFAVMGSAYMERVKGIASPRVGLVNIGTEETKGLELQTQAYARLKEAPVNFIGNVEGRDIPLGACDVAVADGFTGNVILKVTEGMGKLMAGEVKGMLLASWKTKLAALLLKDSLQNFKKMMDYTEHGGAPLLGVTRPVIKAHGSSNAKAFKNAIRQAKECVENDVTGKIRQSLEAMKPQEAAAEQE